MKAYSQNIGKILAKININEHILPIFHQSEKRAKTVKYKESLNINLSKTVSSVVCTFTTGWGAGFRDQKEKMTS